MGSIRLRYYLLFTLLLPLLGSTNLSAQNYFKNQYKDRFYTIAIGTGQNGYFGELNANNNIRRGFRNLTASVEARLYDRVSARVELSYFTISGADRFAADSTFERQRNLSFQSRNFEASLQGVFYLFGYPDSFRKRKTWEPFATAGIGVTRFEPTTTFIDSLTQQPERVSLRDIQTEDVEYNNVTLVVPVGIGVKARVTKFLNVILEAGYRFTFTDYLDDVSTTFRDPDFADGTFEQAISNRKSEVGVINSEAFDQLVAGGARGNPENNDNYLLINFKLEFYIPLLTLGK